MKILERLRSLAGAFPVEPRSIGQSEELLPLDLEPNDDEAPYGVDGEETAFELDAGLPGHTIDGLRRRIPDVHEDIPPESYEFSGETDIPDTR